MSRQKMDTFEYIGNFLVFFEKEHPRKKSERKTYFIKKNSSFAQYSNNRKICSAAINMSSKY